VQPRWRSSAGGSYENRVPATRVSPAYTDTGTQTFSLCERNEWVCIVSPDGREHRNITFEPFSEAMDLCANARIVWDSAFRRLARE
jgi:hypothetical protein